jgi:hypothetical protein
MLITSREWGPDTGRFSWRRRVGVPGSAVTAFLLAASVFGGGREN